MAGLPTPLVIGSGRLGSDFTVMSLPNRRTELRTGVRLSLRNSIEKKMI